MGLNEGIKWQVKTVAVNCMDTVPALRPIITKIIPPLYPLAGYDELLDKALDIFNAKKSSGGGTQNLTDDIRYWCFYHGFPPEEYFLFHFSELSTKQRKQYISNGYKEHICSCLGNFGVKGQVFFDKYKTYLKFKKYYKRDVIVIKTENDFDIFDGFLRKHAYFIKKPINLSRGRGIEKISATYEKSESRRLFGELLQQGETVCEEIILNVGEWALFNPGCLNTVRISSFCINGKVTIFHPFARFGRSGKVVDNAGSGGLLCAVDSKTGQVISDAVDEFGNSYYEHPDSRKAFKGFKLPCWNDLTEIVEDLFKTAPEMQYVGWDMAFTDRGWVLVEANAGGQMNLVQYATQEPLLEELQDILSTI